jgi:pimeloyl-ACP methyl ester carboxylesterase
VEHQITHGQQRLAVQEDGEGPTVVGLHGLTATRRYVLMGSRTLERSGRRVVLYDARGHGASTPPPDGDYSYGALAGDLAAVLDALEIEHTVLVGASMGAHTALRFALEHPERVSALALVTPGYDPEEPPLRLARWDALARGLREGGIDGFIAAYEFDRLPAAWRASVELVIRQRLGAHRSLDAEALSAVPRSPPFGSWQALAAIAIPTLVVASRDESDPDHPLALAQAYAGAIAGARLVVEDEGRSPIAWQGGQLSRLLLDF